VIAIHQESHVLDKMDDWNQQHHGDSGLIERVQKSEFTRYGGICDTLNFIKYRF